ncbi:MAG: hypothetical protein HC898_00945 [Phycisphaerales bacterium]|nr:hypothetical protein [Phycisphaerales bacterium]
MKLDSSNNLAVLISHRLPDATGSAEARRTWQLLTMLARRCRVDLFSLTQGPVHWETYRKAHHVAHRMWVQPSSFIEQLRPVQKIAWTGPGRILIRRFTTMLQEQHWSQTAAVVVTTHPDLALLGYIPPAHRRVCDLGQSARLINAQKLKATLDHSDYLISTEPIQDQVTLREWWLKRVVYLPQPQQASASTLLTTSQEVWEDRWWSALGFELHRAEIQRHLAQAA